jgi:hypothetical protein
MIASWRALAGLAAALALAACGGGGNRTRAEDLSQFQCNSRRVEYLEAGGFAAAETGVRMECGAADGPGNPRITRWRVEEDGKRKTESFRLSADQFDGTWQKIDATGWRFLDAECSNPGAGKTDPVYQIGVGDHAAEVSLNCRGRELPFPYDRLVNELDLRAAGFGDDSGSAL